MAPSGMLTLGWRRTPMTPAEWRHGLLAASEVDDAEGGLRPSSDGRRQNSVGVWAAAAADGEQSRDGMRRRSDGGTAGNSRSGDGAAGDARVEGGGARLPATAADGGRQRAAWQATACSNCARQAKVQALVSSDGHSDRTAALYRGGGGAVQEWERRPGKRPSDDGSTRVSWQWRLDAVRRRLRDEERWLGCRWCDGVAAALCLGAVRQQRRRRRRGEEPTTWRRGEEPTTWRRGEELSRLRHRAQQLAL
ncbi:hypothetical protein E2562_034738 [Oryza meyeriana var. granulata]|uniref:Uncharacterized protein n=1 Tax=Oryza meyeriana var. granulata TaxID=110450 RepID=A0A6G1CWM7_9ORYZ|nr:hypothetical protein E2562_034738 [Oryza meyeriana var. granulata]